jgi:hypothetical protein
MREGGEQRLNPVGEPTKHGVRERDRPLEPRAAHELDGFVDRGIARNAVDEPELVGPQPQGRTYWRIEASDASTPKRLDSVVKRPDTLDGAESESLCQCAIARVEICRCRSKCAIGVGVVLEVSQENLERRRAGRPYGRRPRSHAS